MSYLKEIEAQADELKRSAGRRAEIIHILELRAATNERAVRDSPRSAEWSMGVAKGMRIAIKLLEEE